MKSKPTATTHAIQITTEQISLIRSLVLRVDMLYTHNGVAIVLEEDGTVERKPLYECWFCRHGSYESAAAIKHPKSCIVAQIGREFGALNEQFMTLERKAQ